MLGKKQAAVADPKAVEFREAPHIFAVDPRFKPANQSVWFDFTTGDKYRCNELGAFEGEQNNSGCLTMGDKRARFLVAEDHYVDSTWEENAAALDKLSPLTLQDYNDLRTYAFTKKITQGAFREKAQDCFFVSYDERDIANNVQGTWEKYIMLKQWIVEQAADASTKAEFGKANDPEQQRHQAEYTRITNWGMKHGLIGTEIFAQWGPIKSEMGGCTDASLQVLDAKVHGMALLRSDSKKKAEIAEREVFNQNSIASAAPNTPKPAQKTDASTGKTKDHSVLSITTSNTADAKSSAGCLEGSESKSIAPAQSANLITVNTETGELSVSAEELNWLLRCEDVEALDAQQLETVDKILNACNDLTAQCFKIATLATSEINKRISVMATLLYRFGGDLRAFAIPKLKGKEKTWKSPNLSGSLHYRKTGGLKCTNKAEQKAWAQKLTDEELAKYPFLKVEVVIDQKELNKWQKAHPETLLPGWEDIPIHEHGIQQFGDGKPFSLTKLKTALKSVNVTALTNYLTDEDDEDDEDE